MAKVFGDFGDNKPLPFPKQKRKTGMGHVYTTDLIKYNQEMVEFYSEKRDSTTDLTQREKFQEMIDKYQRDYEYMSLSQDLTKPQPKLEDIIAFSERIGVYPAEAAKRYESEVDSTYPYPKYIIKKAEQDMFLYARLGFTKTKKDWCEEHVTMEDQRFGMGFFPLRNIVDKRIAQFENLKSLIIKNQDEIIDIILRHHIYGEPMTFPAYLNVDDTLDIRTYPFEIVYQEDLLSLKDVGMGGFFDFVKSIVKVVLTPLEKLALSPAKKLLDSAAFALLPDRYAESIANLTEAQVQVLKGDLSKESVRNYMKTSIKAAMIPAAASGEMMSSQLDLVKNIPVAGSLVEGIDKYSGGLISSVENLALVPTKVQSGEKVDVTATLIDAGKIGAIILSGGTAGAALAAVAATTATNFVSEKTGLNDSFVGQAISAGTKIYSGQGFGDIATGIAKNVAVEQAQKQALKTEAGETIVGKAVISAAGQSIVGKSDFFPALSEAAQEQAKTMVVSEVEQRTHLPVGKYVSVGQTLDAASQRSVDENMAVLRTQAEVAVQARIMESERRIENEQRKAIERQQELQRQLESVSEESIRNRINNEITATQKELQDKMEAERKALQQDMANIQSTMDSELRRIQSDYENFDLSSSMNDEWNRLQARIQAEQDRLAAGWSDKLWDLSKKYGPKLLAYLMYMYGPKPDYDNEVRKLGEKKIRYIYQYWEQPESLFNPDIDMSKRGLDGKTMATIVAVGFIAAAGLIGMKLLSSQE